VAVVHLPPVQPETAMIVASRVGYGAGKTWGLEAPGTSMDLPTSEVAKIDPQVNVAELPLIPHPPGET
jgi:hypothetical protein